MSEPSAVAVGGGGEGSRRVVALVGNPNVGKTSLFNALTGRRLPVGNYAGVTVELARAEVDRNIPGGAAFELLDLPGTYSLSAQSEDEAVAVRALSGREGRVDAAVLVVDATNLARNLYLALQLRELGVPLVVALNMSDLAEAAGMAVDSQALGRALGATVVPTVARDGRGLEAVVAALSSVSVTGPQVAAADESTPDLRELEAQLRDAADTGRARVLVAAAACEELDALRPSDAERHALAPIARAVTQRAAEQAAILRYGEVDRILAELTPADARRGTPRVSPMAVSERVDRVLTHPVAGLLIFVGVMATLFQSIFSWAEPLMDVVDGGMSALSSAAVAALPAGAVRDLMVEGVIAGVGNVVIFVPQIAMLFLFITLLEDSGYLARAAFLMDRLMARIGLHGRAFVPLLSGYACAVPAIMATRTISSFRDRLVTILMVPFMSCSARLPIYALVIFTVFRPEQQVWGPFDQRGVALLAMYGLSTFSALAIGAIYKRTLLRSPTPPLVLELPPYRRPRLGNVLTTVRDKVFEFLREAGTVILACTVVLWALLTYPKVEASALSEGETAVQHTVAGRVGRAMEPALAPIGQDWRMGIGLLGSFAAREVFVSTLGIVVGIEAEEGDEPDLREALLEPDPRTGRASLTPLSGVALMVFFVYACQCMSTLAVVRRETRSWRWPLFMFASMTAIAYVAALLVFQIGRVLGYQ